MSSDSVRLNRRQLLRGAAGFTLALPFLSSLAPRAAHAGPTGTRKPRLVSIGTDHGGAFESSMFPSASLLTRHMDLFPGHTVSAGALSATMSGSDAVLSPILRAPATMLTAARVAKINVLHGLDVPFYIAHNTGQHLGNYARNDGNGGDGLAVQMFPRPTIDQIMAWSSSFYGDLSSIRERAMVMNSGRQLSWNWSDPTHRSGAIQNVRGYDSSRDLFNAIFVPDAATMPHRPPIADRVLESYHTLRNGNRRLSAGDRQRLDDHIDRLSELERRLGARASCGGIMQPTDDADHHVALSPADAAIQAQLFNDVIVAAFICGTSRIAVHGLGDTSRFAGFSGDWHQDVAHQWQNADKQALLVASYQRVFQDVFMDLVNKLDTEEADGFSYLDNTLIMWTQECGMETHSSVSTPVVTAGSAAGFFNTGLFVDYRKVGAMASSHDPGAGGTQYLGVLYAQWLANVLQAMGVPRSEFELDGNHGYGYPYLGTAGWLPPYVAHYQNTSSQYFQHASDLLPFLAA